MFGRALTLLGIGVASRVGRPSRTTRAGSSGQLPRHYQVGQKNQLDTLGMVINIVVLWQMADGPEPWNQCHERAPATGADPAQTGLTGTAETQAMLMR